MGRERWPWIDDMLGGRKIAFPDETVWELEKKLSEASEETYPPAEARAVYVCRQLKGPQVGSQAIVKVRMQMPDTEMPHPNPSERAKYASKELNDYTENEIDVLRTLTESGCSAAPKLLSWTRELQDETMWVPGGYVVYILMEKLPGAPPFNFWVEKDLSLEDRDTVRKGFRAALSEVKQCGIIPMDRGLQNLLWDAISRKCYIVDFEDCVWDDKPEWKDLEYFLWGLAQMLSPTEDRW